jgi:hypothetical protein
MLRLPRQYQCAATAFERAPSSTNLSSRLPDALITAHLNWIILALVLLLLQPIGSMPGTKR